MAIRVVPYEAEHVGPVRAFNARMQAGGAPWGWYTQPVDAWLPPRPGVEVWREHYVAVDDEGAVRGAYALKPQTWHVRGEPVVVTDWQGPISEGVVDRRYNTLGLRLMRDMVKRRALLYSWGHGEDETHMLQMLRKMGWQLVPTPLCIRVLRPHRFLRRNAYLRRSARHRWALDALAWSGAGWVGLKALDAARRLARPRTAGLDVEEAARFDAWADGVWERSRGGYAALGLRDAATLNALLPEGGWPDAIRLRVRRGGEDVGWAAVMDHAHEADRRFGSLRLGTLIDGLARPEDAPLVVAAATEWLADRGVDLIVSNQAHPAWLAAFARSGFVPLAGRRLLAVSPALGEALAPLDETARGLHLTNLDGHGPHGL